MRALILAIVLLAVIVSPVAAAGPSASVRITGDCSATEVWVDYSGFTPNDVVSVLVVAEGQSFDGNPWNVPGTGASVYGVSGSGSELVAIVTDSGWVGVRYAVDPTGPLPDWMIDPEQNQIPINVGLGDNPTTLESGVYGACGSGDPAVRIVAPPATGTAPMPPNSPVGLWLGLVGTSAMLLLLKVRTYGSHK